MNMRLDNPPVIDVSVSRHMGLFAVARLAERHGVRVRLRARSPRGLIALVWLPDSVTEHGTAPSGWSGGRLGRPAADAVRASGSHGIGAHAAPDGLPAGGQLTGGQLTGGQLTGGQPANGWQGATAPTLSTPSTLSTTPAPPAPPAPARPAQAAAAPREPAQAANSAVSDWFRSPRSPASDNSADGNSAAGSGASGNDGSPAAAPPAGGGWRAGADGWAEGRHAAQIVAEPVRGDQTAAGLPVRVPRANLIPGSAGGHRVGGGATSRPPDGRPGDSRPADSRGAQAAPAARAPRSPELARSRLSGFQRGTRRAKGQTPRAGEGADR
jgi:hypothetical protein